MDLHISDGSVSDGGREGVSLQWLGQAGFALRVDDELALIDPYLSDSLAVKYKDAEFKHIRMMPSPIAPGDVKGVSAVLCTHRHTDHIDPGTLPPVASANPGCRFVVPRAEIEPVRALGLPEDRIVAMNAGEEAQIAPGISVRAIPSAHEELKTNSLGEHHFLGYIIKANDIIIYHSGDCTPYDDMEQWLKGQGIDLALLPVNGRDTYRTSRGILGNFTFEEAVALCRVAAVPKMIAHHFGMFDFNTVDPELLSRQALAIRDVRCVVPEIGKVYELTM